MAEPPAHVEKSALRKPRLPTRAILISAALAALQTLVFFAVVPLTTALAATVPPAYAAVAGIHSLMPFTARLVTGVPGTAAITALITGVLTAAFSPIGLLAAVPMLTAGIVFDAVMPWRDRHAPVPLWRVLLAAVVAGVALFFVSLPVFSSEHLVAPVLVATVVCRMLGEAAAAFVAFALTRALARGGLVRYGRSGTSG
jgi:hypothetical protein